MGILASFPTFAGLIQIVSSYLVERRGERRLFTAWLAGTGRLLWLPILLVPVFLPDSVRFGAFAALLLASSILISAPVPAFTSWMADLVPPDNRGRYFGRRNMLAGITTMVVSLPAAWFLDLAVKQHRFAVAAGFGTIFGIASVSAIADLICLLRQAEPPMKRPDTVLNARLGALLAFYRAPFADRKFRRLMFYSGFFAIAQFFAAPFYVVYALTVLKLDYVWLQIFATLASLASLLSMPLWGYLSDKFGNRPLLAIANFGVGLLPLLWIPTSRSFIAISLVIICINNLLGGLFWAGVGLTQFNLLIGETPDERKSVYIGAMSAVIGLCGGLAPILGGVLVTALHGTEVPVLGLRLGNYQLVFAVNAALRFLSLIGLARVRTTGAATTRDVLTQIGSARVGAWVNIRRLQRARSEEGRRHAMSALRSVRSALAVEELVTALDDPSLNVREEAAEALGEIGDPRAVDALIAHLHDPASGIVDESAAALGRIGDERAVAPLCDLLKSGDKPDRIAAARALGRIGHSAAVEPLLVIVRFRGDAEPPEVVEACVAALGAIGEPAAAEVLIPLLNSPSRTLRLTVVRALGDIGDEGCALPLLTRLAGEPDSAIIAHISVALAMVGSDEALRPVLDSMERVESPIGRKQMLNAAAALLGIQAALYPVLAMEPFARDEAVSRILKEMGRAEGEAGFGPRRRRRITQRVLDDYLAGRLSEAISLLARTAHVEGPEAEAVAWAMRTAARRPLTPDELLFALFVIREIWSTEDATK